MDRIRNHDQSGFFQQDCTAIAERTRAEFSATGQEMQLGLGIVQRNAILTSLHPGNFDPITIEGYPYPDQERLFTVWTLPEQL